MVNVDNQKESIIQKEIDVEKIISYDATSNFTYFYPRLKLFEEDKRLILDKIEVDLNLLLQAFNHLFEIMVITFEEFEDLMTCFISKKLTYKVKLKDLIYSSFYEEYYHYIRPIIQLSENWVKVETSYDKYYFFDQGDQVAYRLDKQMRIISYKVIFKDFIQISLQPYFSNSQKVVHERIVLDMSTNVFTQLK